jgi:hypothetical protein
MAAKNRYHPRNDGLGSRRIQTQRLGSRHSLGDMLFVSSFLIPSSFVILPLGAWDLELVHGSVCTSTESTAGRSRTIGFHLSPALADA